MTDYHVGLFWGLLWIQFGGMASLIAFRLQLSEQANRCCQALFYGSLGMVGLGTLFALMNESPCWICSAFSLSILTIGATWEPPTNSIEPERPDGAI